MGTEPSGGEWPISRIVIGTRHRRDTGDVSSLAASIAELGLLHPVVVKPDGCLIAGERRIRACEKLGWISVPVRIVDLANVMRGELAENVERVQFLPSEIEAIRRALEPTKKAAARERMTLGKVSLGSDAGRTADKIGAFAGISGRTVTKIAAVVAAAEREPDKFAKLVADMDRTGHVDGIYRRLSNIRQAEKIRSEPPPLPRGRYRVIAADPPWPYELSRNDPSSRGVHPYPTMHIDQICALPVANFAETDCVLFMSAPSLLLANGTAARVVDAWGFSPRTILTWAKNRMGNGSWLRGQTEHCIMAVRGKPVVTLTNQTTLLHAPVRAHSQKPEEFFKLVEALCPAPKFLELFSRQSRPGWDAWGDEVAAIESLEPADA